MLPHVDYADQIAGRTAVGGDGLRLRPYRARRSVSCSRAAEPGMVVQTPRTVACPEGITRQAVIEIDGRELSIEEFGRMLTTYSGWGMRIEFVPEDEVHRRPARRTRAPPVCTRPAGRPGPGPA